MYQTFKEYVNIYANREDDKKEITIHSPSHMSMPMNRQSTWDFFLDQNFTQCIQAIHPSAMVCLEVMTTSQHLEKEKLYRTILLLESGNRLMIDATFNRLDDRSTEVLFEESLIDQQGYSFMSYEWEQEKNSSIFSLVPAFQQAMKEYIFSLPEYRLLHITGLLSDRIM